jgi:hypothetical protein
MIPRSIQSRLRRFGRRHRTPRSDSRPRSPDELPELFASLGIARDYSGLDLDGLVVDLRGWGSVHPIFEDVFQKLRPRLVIEVGTWKGASLLHMHALGRKYGCGTRFVAVDTWLGSNESIWRSAEDREQLMLRGGYPTMFRQFAFNLLAHDAADDVFPLPMTSTMAARLLAGLGVVADAVYVDAGHAEEEVASDLRLYYDVLRSGGALFGDDFDDRWPGVVRAVERFGRRRGLRTSAWDAKWILWKP